MNRRSWTVAAAYLRPGRCSLVALMLAAVVTFLFAWFAATGNLNSFPQVLKPLLIPGIFGLYIVGTVTGSMPLAFAAHAVCMTIVYLAVGVLVDLMVRWRQQAFNGPNKQHQEIG